MGYRSDVAYTIRFVHEDKDINKQSFYVFLAEAKANAATAACFEEHEWMEFVVDEDNYHINFFTENVKWYESFADVQCHEALLNLAKEWDDDEDNRAHIGIQFIRIGEEADDIEDRRNESADDWIYLERSISRDW